MKISTRWLKDLVAHNLSPSELADALTMVGFEVEDIIHFDPEFKGILIGEVLDVGPHPDADKLRLCRVNTGSETPLQIICGAPNVAAGQKVAVAVPGSRLPGDLVIKPVKLRGVMSQGMICSEKELGIGDDQSGIMVLDSREIPGQPFGSDTVSTDTVLDLFITPNRPDCLSHIGIAREVSVITGESLRKPAVNSVERSESAESTIRINVKDPKGCPRYSARIVREIRLEPSPRWLRERLASLGVRSINNVVDVTNLVLLETGHPLHAFDLGRIQGNEIIVRKATEGETFTTLDGVDRNLTPQDLLICDHERPVALAGIMGGANSEVGEKTRDILLESAYFDPVTIRQTSKRLGLSTEASQRFERGADPNGT
ncbi:phenylalanine--tRNA ligase subunit beta, partial [bacterium]|nr:phenylalanine--tRNA ligase subunit beta [candidate division CSSED10-310 bacterium]